MSRIAPRTNSSDEVSPATQGSPGLPVRAFGGRGMHRFAYAFHVITARHAGPCLRCDTQIQPGDRIAWNGSATHVACITCRDCGKLTEAVNGDRRCEKCAHKAHAATPEGQVERRARRSVGASKAADTRRRNACKHADATSRGVPYDGPATQLKWDCPACGKTRWTGLNGETIQYNDLSQWRWL